MDQIMDQTIVLDCQTKSNTPSCESCIVYKDCKTRKKPRDKDASALEGTPTLTIEITETSIVS
ncbi:MAG: hypothetical protein ACLQO7_07055 [Candidatus Bathyarchaeia archaeon]